MQLQFAKFYKSDDMIGLLSVAAYLNPLFANNLEKMGVVGRHADLFKNKIKHLLCKVGNIEEGDSQDDEHAGAIAATQDSLDIAI